jgi:hypothetical protein
MTLASSWLVSSGQSSPPTGRVIRRFLLTHTVGKIHPEPLGTYGSRSVQATFRLSLR